MKNFIAISMLLLLSLRVIAGDPGGISLLVKALPSANDYKYVLDGFFRNYYGVDNPHTPSCDQNDYTPYIDNVYLNTLPKGIDDNILIKSITDLPSRTQIAKILSSYSDDQVSGFDGVLFYAMKDNKLFIYTFDSKAPGHIFTNELNVDGIISYKLLGRSICQSIRSKILPSSP
ncbi:hypothetical protein [Klebsiella pneumoniae]|uniref:hypothetical protein n=1 Tax=Klebsiella pneumoniae TaxID=573 RepID=UPI001FF6982A|nr:hypothetical protein [Klebsiella pneumoniae]MCJ8570857.1 hypothetical protein [Klebsiella pneumoniae]